MPLQKITQIESNKIYEVQKGKKETKIEKETKLYQDFAIVEDNGKIYTNQTGAQSSKGNRNFLSLSL